MSKKTTKPKRIFTKSQRPPVIVKPNPKFLKRLKQLMKEQRLSGGALAKKAGTGYTAIYDILSHKSKVPLPEALQSIAQALGVDVAYLWGTSDDRTLPTESPRKEVPILGIAETGVYRVMPTVLARNVIPLRKIDAPAHPRYPFAQHFALEIGADDSMNATKPVPIIPGMLALCVDVSAANTPIETGRLYAIRIANKSGELHQAIIRRVVLQPGGYELLAETTDKNCKSSFYAGKPSTNPSDPVCIFGLLYRLEIDLT